MNSTPNYGFESIYKSSDAAVDRELRRVEDLVETNAAAISQNADAIDVNTHTIIQHGERIQCLREQAADRYTKAEVDAKLECKSSCCGSGGGSGGLDGGVAIPYTPELRTSDDNQDFTPLTQEGYYVLVGDMCHCFFTVRVDIQNSKATGKIEISMPIPTINEKFVVPINYLILFKETNVASIGLHPSGKVVRTTTDGRTNYLNMDDIRITGGEQVMFRGVVSYLWR